MASRNKRLLGLVAVLVVGVIAAACGGDDGDDDAASGTPEPAVTEGGETESGYIYAGDEEQTEEAREAGEEAAGEPADPPQDRTIGIIQLSGQSATSVLITASLREIGEMFGYDVEVCDPDFDPQKVPQCATSIVAKNPDVIFSVSQNPGPLGSGFNQAAQDGIPWFGTGTGATENPDLIDYGIPGFEIAKALDEYMFEQLDERFPDADSKKVLALVAPTVGRASLNQQTQLQDDSEAQGDVELIEHDLDLENIVQDTLETSRQTLEQNPDLAAMWTLCDFCTPLMAQVANQAQPDERETFVGGQFSNPETIADIRSGDADAVADYPWDLPAWVGMDQVLQQWARDAEIEPDFSVFETYPLPFMRPYVITQENALESGAAPIYGPDYRTFFTTKWEEEFGIGS